MWPQLLRVPKLKYIYLYKYFYYNVGYKQVFCGISIIVSLEQKLVNLSQIKIRTNYLRLKKKRGGGGGGEFNTIAIVF